MRRLSLIAALSKSSSLPTLNLPSRTSVFLLLAAILAMVSVTGEGHRVQALKSKSEHKIRHTRGKYSMKEETVKRVEINHPCRLTRSSVKVSFPEMKDDLLVSFIGYKEPRLMHVNRCKGLCSSEAIGRVACVATKRRWKTVNMQLKTQVVGRESKERFKELVLEEHTECACQCLSTTAADCLGPELFNNATCSCS